MTDHVNAEAWIDDDRWLFDDIRHDPEARERYGGMSLAAGCFGWLTAVAVALLLPNIIGAVAVAIGASTDVREWGWLQDWASASVVVAVAVTVALLLVLLVAYYAGGYVAGRMCRFDGARQGVAVWLTGLVVAVLALALGLVMRPQFDVGDSVTAGVSLSGAELAWAGAVAAVVVLVTTLLAAMAGAVVGNRYHEKVDRAAGR